MRRAVISAYVAPATPMTTESAAAIPISCHGAVRSAAMTSTAEKWTMFGVPNARPASSFAAARAVVLAALPLT